MIETFDSLLKNLREKLIVWEGKYGPCDDVEILWLTPDSEHGWCVTYNVLNDGQVLGMEVETNFSELP